MKVDIHGDKVKITTSIEDYINSKLERLSKYFSDNKNIKVRVVIRVKGYNQIIEVTIPLNNFILRSEESHSDLYAAIDLVIDKLERQINKNKSKIQSKKFKSLAKAITFNEDNEYEEETETKIVKRKVIEMKPMNEEEAILQLNMLGHDFFVYKHDVSNQICVLYKRKDGNYGVIETS
ncbi:MAG: ribosome-associated translation inhibitor RaiA [Bacilli bacterium]|jgi:putative sigma-54 modulation protein|nr:ribosome-associated translation inhibitor RaiA [Bacilli bacterium]